MAVVQARMGSSRFPGKMLARLGEHTLIEWVFGRVVRARTLDAMALATSAAAENDALEAVARAMGLTVIRGDESDVLSRFVTAARATDAAWVVRICADNPFIDPTEIDRLVAFARAENVDYAFNHLNRLNNGYADGFGAEMLTAETLYAVDASATEPSHREHVTQYLWRHPERYRIRTFPAPPALAHADLRFDIDTPDDLARLEPLAQLGIHATAAEFVAAEMARRA